MNSYSVLVGKLEEKEPLKDLGLDGKKLLRHTLKKCDSRAWIGYIGLGSSGIVGEHYNKA